MDTITRKVQTIADVATVNNSSHGKVHVKVYVEQLTVKESEALRKRLKIAERVAREHISRPQGIVF